MKKFSIVLIAYNNRDSVKACLASIEKLDYDPQDFDVILVDDGSDEPLVQTLTLDSSIQFQTVYLPRSSTSSRARARNQGAALAQSDSLVFVDSDHYLSAQLLQGYARYFDTFPSKKMVLGTRVDLEGWQTSLLFEGKRSSDALFERIRSRDYRYELEKTVGMPFNRMAAKWNLFWSCNFAIQKSFFDSLGGFDEQFLGWGMEDVEFGYRVLQSGEDFDLLENNIYHFFNDFPFLPQKYIEWVINVERFYLKYHDLRIMQQMCFESIFFSMAKLDDYPIDNWYHAFKKFNQKVAFMTSRVQSGS